MPVRVLPSKPNLDHLKHQAKDLLKAHAARSQATAQLIREFHPSLRGASDETIFATEFKLSDAQLTIAREHGFPSWARLKRRIEKPVPSDRLDLPHHERIEDPIFRQAVALIDAGDALGLRDYLEKHPLLAHRRVMFEGVNYFRNPTLLEFIAENPIRHGTMPKNVVAIAEILLDAGADQTALNETLGLVCSGRIAHECGVQVPLIDLFCSRGANPDHGMQPAVVHGEFEAAEALISRGARTTLAVAAALDRVEDVRYMLPTSDSKERHLALAMASQFGRLEIVGLLLEAGEDPNRYNPIGSHSHSTPLHQAALAGHKHVVRLLVEHGARLDIKDLLWQGMPADWAHYAGKAEVEAYLRALEIEAAKQN